MAKTREAVNPFYILLVVVGVVFSITAFAYCVMAYRAIAPAAAGHAGGGAGPHALTTFLDKHGITILTWELGLLAAFTFGAMWLDRFRSLRARGPFDPPKQAPRLTLSQIAISSRVK